MRGVRSLVVLFAVAVALGAYIYFVESRRDPAGTEPSETVFTLEAAAIDHLTISTPGGDVTTLDKVNGLWRLTAPVAAPADQSAVGSVTSALASMDIVTVLDESPVDLAPYGLDPPELTVAFRAAGASEDQRLALGSETPTGTDVYARASDSSRLLLVASYQRDALDRTPFDLRDKSVLDVASGDVDRVTINRPPDAALQLVRESGDWRMTGPVAATADFGLVSDLLDRVDQARMSSIVSEGEEPTPAELREYGLTSPRLTATLGTGSASATLVIGGESSPGSVYARDASRPIVFTVPESLLDDLTVVPFDLRVKDVFAFKPFSALAIDITHDGTTASFVKTPAEAADAPDTWRQTAPTERAINETGMVDLLNTLASLRAEEFTTRATGAGDEMDEMIVTARYGDVTSPSEERVVLQSDGTTAYAVIDGSQDSAVVPAADFNRAVQQFEELTTGDE